jgi:Cu2+-exporting ATPase
MVSELASEGGWDRFYELRQGYSPRPEPGDVSSFDHPAFLEAHSRVEADGRRVADFQIGGLRCAACVWLIERGVGRLPGVESIHASFSTGRARVVWSEGSVRLSQIARRIQELGYQPRIGGSAPRTAHALLGRLGVAAFISMNVMMLSVSIYLGWFEGMEERHAALMRWMILALATPAVFYSSQPFFTRALAGLREGILSMDVPIALAIALLYGHGVWATLRGEDGYLDSLTMLVALLLAGRFVEDRGRARAEAAAGALLSRVPTLARRVTGTGVEEVPVSQLALGDRIAVGKGAVVPVDARIEEGSAEVDLSLVTGEAEAVTRGPGAELPAGCSILEGGIELRVTAVGDDTLLARLARMVASARASRAPLLQLSDRIAPWFTLATLVAAVATFVSWSLLHGTSVAIAPTVAVLVVACPCALALATPAALSVGIGAAARRGAFIRDGEVLMRLAEVDAIAFDKTGTLTAGRPEVTSASDEALRIAAAVERTSLHPVARAILRETERRGIALDRADDIVETTGRGIAGRVDNAFVEVRAGSSAGSVEVFSDGIRVGEIRMRDRLRPGAERLIHDMGLEPALLTGDAAAAAHEVASLTGITRVHAGLSPEAKVAWLEARRAEGRKVLFVGDGINDTAALAAAHVGVAMGAGAPAALLAADVTLVEDAVAPVLAAVRAARITRATIVRNARGSVIYNASAVTAAAFGLVNPLVAAILMPISSMVVVLAALSVERRLRDGYPARLAPAVDDARSAVCLDVCAGGAQRTV